MDLIFFREKEDRKSEYKNNLIKLNKFVMIKYDQDTMVTPEDSQWLITFYTKAQFIWNAEISVSVAIHCYEPLF